MNAQAKLIRDRRLRRRLLFALYECRAAPQGGLSGQTLHDVGASGLASDQQFVDELHTASLLSDLERKGLIDRTDQRTRKTQLVLLSNQFFRITDKGSMLIRESIEADPDIEDDRLPGVVAR